MGVRIVGEAAEVVDTGLMCITELAGNVATHDDRISIASVTVTAPTCEPWLTLDYDEWICVTTGVVTLTVDTTADPTTPTDTTVIHVRAGTTCLVERGTRFQPSFPEPTTYIPVCLPAFRPDRCIREEEGDTSAVAERLAHLHATDASATVAVPAAASDSVEGTGGATPEPAEVLYHMCEQSRWDAAHAGGGAYFPPTFEADGFTHATAVATRLIPTANHFYQESTDDWVCLSFKRSVLRDMCGIMTRDEEALPVGDKPVGAAWDTWICPHVVGGIPVRAVHSVVPILRTGKEFVAIGTDELLK